MMLAQDPPTGTAGQKNRSPKEMLEEEVTPEVTEDPSEVVVTEGRYGPGSICY